MNRLNAQIMTGWQRLMLVALMPVLWVSPLVQAEATAPPQFRPDAEIDSTTPVYPPGMSADFPADNRQGALTRQQFINEQEIHRKRMQQAFQQQQQSMQQRTVEAMQAPAATGQQQESTEVQADAAQKHWEQQKTEQAKRWQQQQTEYSQRRQQQWQEWDLRRQQMQAEQQRMQQAPPQFHPQPVVVPLARPHQAPAYGYGYPVPRGYGYAGYPSPPYGYGVPGRAYPDYPPR